MTDRSRSIEQITERAWKDARRAECAGKLQAALDYLDQGLEADPYCYELLIYAAELRLLNGDELTWNDGECALRSIPYFDRAISARPEIAEAHISKALAFLYREQPSEALSCLEVGEALYEQWPNTDVYPAVRMNIGESLYNHRTVALLQLGRTDEARRALHEGLRRFPESEYLTDLIERFLPPELAAGT